MQIHPVPELGRIRGTSDMSAQCQDNLDSFRIGSGQRHRRLRIATLATGRHSFPFTSRGRALRMQPRRALEALASLLRREKLLLAKAHATAQMLSHHCPYFESDIVFLRFASAWDLWYFCLWEHEPNHDDGRYIIS